jgi:probable F420-dependent oxidoreductase
VHCILQLPTDAVEAGAELISAAAVAEMARAAERAGFDALSVTDHPAPPARWVAAGGHHSLDPFVALSFAAAATSRIRLHTHVLVLPYRHPLLVAKAAASLDVLSGGRLTLGVAAGYLEREFSALGARFETRNDATDHAILTLRQAWRGEPMQVPGSGAPARDAVQRPPPLQRPGPPIWVGGNARRAIRRAVELGDGWAPFPAPPGLSRHTHTARLETLDDLRAGIAYARAHAEAVGRSAPLAICFVPFGTGMGHGPVDVAHLREQLPALAEAGVDWLHLTLPAPSRAAWCEAAAACGAALCSPAPV